MKTDFAVQVQKFAVLQSIQGAWQMADYIALLDALEFGDTSELTPADCREMCLMSLQDLSPEDAAAVLLRYRLGEQLNKGQIENISNQMADEKMWEEYVDFALHEQMFNVGSLLYQAFPHQCPEPDAVQVTLEITASNKAAQAVLAEPLHESMLVRLIASGMDEQATLLRLFGDQIAGQAFPEADTIIWIARQDRVVDSVLNVELISSGYWLDVLREVKSFNSNAYADE